MAPKLAMAVDLSRADHPLAHAVSVQLREEIKKEQNSQGCDRVELGPIALGPLALGIASTRYRLFESGLDSRKPPAFWIRCRTRWCRSSECAACRTTQVECSLVCWWACSGHRSSQWDHGRTGDFAGLGRNPPWASFGRTEAGGLQDPQCHDRDGLRATGCDLWPGARSAHEQVCRDMPPLPFSKSTQQWGDCIGYTTVSKDYPTMAWIFVTGLWFRSSTWSQHRDEWPSTSSSNYDSTFYTPHRWESWNLCHNCGSWRTWRRRRQWQLVHGRLKRSWWYDSRQDGRLSLGWHGNCYGAGHKCRSWDLWY